MGPIATLIRQRLEAALAPTALDVIDETHLHAGHAGHNALHGESHFRVRVEAPAFAAMSRLARQRAVNEAVGDLLTRERVHALAIEARAPGDAGGASATGVV